MKDPTKPRSTSLQLAQARQLMALGHHQEALTLALDALLRELHHLRRSLKALEEAAQEKTPETAAKEEPPSPPRIMGLKNHTFH